MTTMLYVIFSCYTLGPVPGCNVFRPFLSTDHVNQYATAEECTAAAKILNGGRYPMPVTFKCMGKPVTNWEPVGGP